MKVAIPAVGDNLDAEVDTRLGTCAFLLVVDTETMELEAVPGFSAGSGAGIRTVLVALEKDACVILARYVSPRIAPTLRENGLEVVTGAEGTARQALNQYLRTRRPRDETPAMPERAHRAFATSLRQFLAILPMLVGVVFLIGLFKTFISKQMLAPIFSGNPVTDTLWGACFGSILAGNPINSYVIGTTLLEEGVSLFAVAAVIFTWVSVGLVQLPAEVSALGGRFAIARNVTAFVLSVPIGLLTVLFVRCVS